MIPFQIVAIPLLLFLATRCLLRATRATSRRRSAAAGAVVWLLAAISIYNPALLSAAASWVGIGRGADLVFYIFCLAVMLVGGLGSLGTNA